MRGLGTRTVVLLEGLCVGTSNESEVSLLLLCCGKPQAPSKALEDGVQEPCALHWRERLTGVEQVPAGKTNQERDQADREQDEDERHRRKRRSTAALRAPTTSTVAVVTMRIADTLSMRGETQRCVFLSLRIFIGTPSVDVKAAPERRAQEPREVEVKLFVQLAGGIRESS